MSETRRPLGLTLPPITGPLDARIAPLVHALRRDGFPTTASCDGRRTVPWWRFWDAWTYGPPVGLPWINVAVRFDTPQSMFLCDDLIRWLVDRGIVANVSRVYSTITEVPPFIRIEVLSDLPQVVR